MADGSTIDFAEVRTARMAAHAAQRPALKLVHDAAPVKPPPSRFMPAGSPGAVYVGVVRLGREAVEELIALFQAEAGRTGDWTLHDQLVAARDGLVPEPPQSAA